jgi:hypothetical protein
VSTIKVTLPTVKLPDPDKILLAASAAMYQEGQLIANEARNIVPVYDGILRSSINATQPVADPHTGISEVQIYAGGPAASYALFVHEGTRPHWVPIAALKKWAAKVLGNENLAYPVQKKIAKYGTKAKKFLERPFMARRDGIQQKIIDAIGKL